MEIEPNMFEGVEENHNEDIENEGIEQNKNNDQIFEEEEGIHHNPNFKNININNDIQLPSNEAIDMPNLNSDNINNIKLLKEIKKKKTYFLIFDLIDLIALTLLFS